MHPGQSGRSRLGKNLPSLLPAVCTGVSGSVVLGTSVVAKACLVIDTGSRGLTLELLNVLKGRQGLKPGQLVKRIRNSDSREDTFSLHSTHCASVADFNL